MTTMDLTGTWQVREAETTDVSAESAGTGDWMDARVPGCIHLDLLRNERIPDPFYGFNDLEVQWVADANWLYRLSFECSEELLKKEKVELVGEGLDTFAEVVLNGTSLGGTNNMFRRWRWDVGGLLEQEDNELLILFESPRKRCDALAAEDDADLGALFGGNRVYARKAQYASGWDWGPDLNTSGIWRPIYLEGFDTARLADIRACADWEQPGAPLLRVEARVEALASRPAELKVSLTGEDGTRREAAAVDLVEGDNVLSAELDIENPLLWWPRGMGPQNLYELEATVKLENGDLSATRTIGLRRVELVRESDEEGESFHFRINGEPVFCRGANWVPADSFLPRLETADYRRLLERAAEANMNMLRVWGGGIYERDDFYDICDRLGIMVWQDFMMACAAYPEHLEEFRENLRTEAEQTVRRLRSHPSLVLWCGNNECQSLFGAGAAEEGIYEHLLPAICAELDPTRPYWPGSPYGGEDPNSPYCGDQHYWRPWWGWAGADEQVNFPGRFVSEFGFQAPPPLKTIRSYIPSGGHHMQSRVMEHHNRAGGATGRLFKLLAEKFRVPADFEDVVYLMQLTQAENVKTGVDAWRARKFRTGGALFWQLNDCWPATSWSAIDYGGRPKALHHYARRFFAPVTALIEHRGGRFEVKVVNDRPEDFRGELVCGFGRLNGDQSWTERADLEVAANTVQTALARTEEELGVSEPERSYFWCRLIEGEDEIGRDACFPVPYKHVDFPVPEWQVEADPLGAGEYALRISNWCFAKGVWLRLSGVDAEFSDNFFDVFPELPAEVRVATEADLSSEELLRRLSIRCVADTL